MAEKPLRCGCILHTDSDYVVGCPVIQAERMVKLVKTLEKKLEEVNLAAFTAISSLYEVLPEEFIEENFLHGEEEE